MALLLMWNLAFALLVFVRLLSDAQYIDNNEAFVLLRKWNYANFLLAYLLAALAVIGGQILIKAIGRVIPPFGGSQQRFCVPSMLFLALHALLAPLVVILAPFYLNASYMSQNHLGFPFPFSRFGTNLSPANFNYSAFIDFLLSFSYLIVAIIAFELLVAKGVRAKHGQVQPPTWEFRIPIKQISGGFACLMAGIGIVVPIVNGGHGIGELWIFSQLLAFIFGYTARKRIIGKIAIVSSCVFAVVPLVFGMDFAMETLDDAFGGIYTYTIALAAGR